MKNWNGWEIDTLKKHGWSTIRIIKEGSDSDWTDMKDWLSQCCWGKYYIDGVAYDHHTDILIRDYYFDNEENAVLFALRWA
jgi:hypothetical protein